jgi:flagellar biosynthetic protein FliR
MPAAILLGMVVLLSVVGVMMTAFIADLGAFLRELGGR